MHKVTVAIPSYNRPESLRVVLERLVSFENVEEIVVVADAPSEKTLELYKEILLEHPEKTVFALNLCHRGSAKTRNALLKMTEENIGKAEYVLLLDDDFLLPNSSVIQTMIEDLERFNDVGAVGGRMMSFSKLKVDPEFRVPLPRKVAEWLVEFTGFMFGGRWPMFSYGKATNPFMLIRSDLVGKIAFDENYEGTGYREETDLQRQILRLGYKILSDSRPYIYHLATEKGGTRDQGKMGQRMYWKGRNHTYFIIKWTNARPVRTLWYVFCGVVLLTLYRPQYSCDVLRGFRNGYKTAKKKEASSLFAINAS
jgi:GT2 family glycosyltransferase